MKKKWLMTIAIIVGVVLFFGGAIFFFNKHFMLNNSDNESEINDDDKNINVSDTNDINISILSIDEVKINKDAPNEKMIITGKMDLTYNSLDFVTSSINGYCVDGTDVRYNISSGLERLKYNDVENSFILYNTMTGSDVVYSDGTVKSSSEINWEEVKIKSCTIESFNAIDMNSQSVLIDLNFNTMVISDDLSVGIDNGDDSSINVSDLNLESCKDVICDANYKLPTNKESYYGYVDHTRLVRASDLVVPYVNLNSNDAKKVNQEIYKLYKNLINKFNENLKEEIWFTLVEYKTYTNDNVVSIVITTETAGTDVPFYEHYTYNFDLDTGNLLSYKELYKLVGLTDKNIESKAVQNVDRVFKEKYSNYSSMPDFDTYNKNSINNYITSVNDNTINSFIDENHKLNVVVVFEFLAGRGFEETIVTIE